jgi:hypothetical protein
MVRFEGSDNPENCASGSVATGRAFHARQVKGDDPDKMGYPGLPGWRLSLGLQANPIKTCFVEKHLQIEEAKVHQGL